MARNRTTALDDRGPWGCRDLAPGHAFGSEATGLERAMRGSVRRRSGFTLIELMIVVAIVAILAALAIPNFVNQTLKAKQTEAFAMLGSIKNGQYAYLAENDCFLEIMMNPAGPESNIRRGWNTAAAVLMDPCQMGVATFGNLDVQPATGATFFTYDCEADGLLADFEFVCTAVGDLDADGDNSEFITCGETGLDGVMLASSTGQMCLFEGEIFRVSPARY